MGIKVKKGTKGCAKQYLTRNQAIRKLQTNLVNFNRLITWKGVYPVEPLNKSKVTKKSSAPKIFFHRRDIQMIASDPIVPCLREQRAINAKLKKARAKHDIDAQFRLVKNRLDYRPHLLAMVRERYPTKEAAIIALNNCATNLMLFADLPITDDVSETQIRLSRRLKNELLHYLVTMRAIRKAFIAVSGYVIEAEIESIPVHFVMPHQTGAVLPESVDFKLMSTKLEFDSMLIGSLLTGLYKDAGLAYPPELDQSESASQHAFISSGRIKSAQRDFSAGANENSEEQQKLLECMKSDAMMKKVVEKTERRNKIQLLLQDKYVHINAEVPRQIVALLVANCGGQIVDASARSKQDEESESRGVSNEINYYIVDRPVSQIDKAFPRDRLVQPQWLFDSVNAARLLPEADYAVDAELPAHLSPFVAADGEDLQELLESGVTCNGRIVDRVVKPYEPPEAAYLRGEITKEQLLRGSDAGDDEDDDEHEEEDDEEEESENEEDEEANESDESDEEKTKVMEFSADEEEQDERKKSRKARQIKQLNKKNDEDDEMESNEKVQKNRKRRKLSEPTVKESVLSEKSHVDLRKERKMELKIRESMLPKKHKMLYKKMKYSLERSKKEKKELERKRKEIDERKRDELKKASSATAKKRRTKHAK